MPPKKKTEKEEIKEELREEFKKELEDQNRSIREFIKNKGIFYNQKMSEKIDPIVSDEFNKKLRGNGDPGVFELIRDNETEIKEIETFHKIIKGNGKPGALEQIRSLKKQMKYMWIVIRATIVLMIGGSQFGFCLDQIKEYLGLGTKTQQVEEHPKEQVEPSKIEAK